MMNAILLAICLDQGHLLSWTDSTRTYSGPPPGWYVCHRCGQEVVVEYKEGDAGAEAVGVEVGSPERL